jgi:hypothetical protein
MGGILGVLGKMTGKTKFFVGIMLTCLVVLDKVYGLGLDGVDASMTPWTKIMTIWGGVLGMDMVEGINTARMEAKATVAAISAPPPPAGDGK